MASSDKEAFPSIEQQNPGNNAANAPVSKRRRRGTSVASSISATMRTFETSNPPEGFVAGTAEVASSARAAAITANKQSRARRATLEAATTSPLAPVNSRPDMSPATTGQGEQGQPFAPFPNGYHFPPKYSGKESTVHFLKAFWAYTTTPLGFCVVIYGLNVVAWGGMLFLLLCNASPAMCYPTCNDINSPRRKWIEWDSQILNALFCVTGFGLVPWRFRDWYYLLRWTIKNDEVALRRLAGIHRSWFRLGGSEDLPVEVGPDNIDHFLGGNSVAEKSIPFPPNKIPDSPLTGTRAPATPLWKMHYMIWMMVWNTFFQCCLSGFMWGMDRYTRPSWSTGLFVALACIVAALGGLVMFQEGNKVKGIEGVPLSDEDRARLESDKELGLLHYNNIKAKKPKEEAEDKGEGAAGSVQSGVEDEKPDQGSKRKKLFGKA